MNEIDKTNLLDQTKFRLDEIRKIEDYFNSEINQRKLCSKKLSKYVSAFDYIEDFNCFKCKNWRSLYYFPCNCCWCSCRNSKCWIYYCIFFSNRNNKKIIKNNKKQKEKA